MSEMQGEKILKVFVRSEPKKQTKTTLKSCVLICIVLWKMSSASSTTYLFRSDFDEKTFIINVQDMQTKWRSRDT